MPEYGPLYVYESEIPGDWHKLPRIRLWRGDDATRRDPSAEKFEDAVVRIAGSMYDCAAVFKEAPEDDEREMTRLGVPTRARRILGDVLDRLDEGDATFLLYRGGWVAVHDCEGSSLCRLIDTRGTV